MTGCLPDEATLAQFIAEAERLPPRPHHSGLLELAQRYLPGCRFRYAYSRGGWHQPGGLIRPDGQRLAEQLTPWVESRMAEYQDDLDAFIEDFRAAGLLVTRHAGQVHFLVGEYGPRPEDVLQLEIEELHEVLDRLLIAPDGQPVDAAELSEPLHPHAVAPQPVGHPRYRFRRLVDLRRILARLPTEPEHAQPALVRFMTEWSLSSAILGSHYCTRWIVSLSEHPDRYGNPVLHASPISLSARALKHFHWHPEARGLDLGNQIQAFDRAAGYLSAWYFHLVAGGLVPRELAHALMEDWLEGYRYLADRDAALLKGWLERPYSV